MKNPVIVLAGVAALALCAAQPAAAGMSSPSHKQCFRASEIDSTNHFNPSQVNVKTIDRRYFKIKLVGDCRGPDYDAPLIVRTVGSGTICDAIDLDLAIGGHGGPTPCLIKSISPMSAAEAAALPRRERP